MTETDTPTAVPMADPISAVPIPSASREGPGTFVEWTVVATYDVGSGVAVDLTAADGRVIVESEEAVVLTDDGCLVEVAVDPNVDVTNVVIVERVSIN